MLDIASEVDTSIPSFSELVNLKDAMRQFKLPYHKIRYAINTGRIPSWKHKNMILIRTRDAEMLAQEEGITPNIPPEPSED